MKEKKKEILVLTVLPHQGCDIVPRDISGSRRCPSIGVVIPSLDKKIICRPFGAKNNLLLAQDTESDNRPILIVPLIECRYQIWTFNIKDVAEDRYSLERSLI